MFINQILDVVVDYWLVSCVFAVVTWLLKNRYSNGLHKYPGPVLAGFTNWWRFFNVLGRKAHHTHIKLHKQHGDIVRLGPNILSFANPKAIKDIYGLNKGYTKTQFYPVQNGTLKGSRIQSLFSTTDESYHAQFRRCVNHAYSMSTLTSYEPLVDSTIVVFLDQTQKRFAEKGASCDFARWLQFFAFDVIGELAWSTRLGFVERFEDVDGIVENLADFLAYAGPIGQQPWLDWTIGDKNPVKMLLARLNLWNTSNAAAVFASKQIAIRRNALAKSVTTAPSDEKQKDSRAGVDFLARFFQAQRDHPSFMNDFQILSASVSLVFAGSDTTAISLSSIFYFLLRSPPTYAKLMQELDAAVADGTIPHHPSSLVTWAAAQKLPYLDACIQESFRMFPAVGLLLERHEPASGATICGERIPGGTIVGCNAWVLQRRREVFGDDADVYRPERWLDADPAKLKEMKATMFQFGAGARTCIGRNISTLEVYKLVPSFLRRFEIEFVDAGKDWKTENCWFVRQLGFDVRFRPRGKTETVDAGL